MFIKRYWEITKLLRKFLSDNGQMVCDEVKNHKNNFVHYTPDIFMTSWVEILGESKVTAYIYFKTRNLPNTYTQIYSTHFQYFLGHPVLLRNFTGYFLPPNLLGDPEVTANLYCYFAHTNWEGCVICSIYLR